MPDMSSNVPTPPPHAEGSSSKFVSGQNKQAGGDDAALLDIAKKALADFELESVMEDAIDALGGGKERTEKEKTDKSKEAKRVVKNQESAGPSAETQNTQFSSSTSSPKVDPQSPKLPIPEISARFPLGKDGIGNPWLKPSLATALFQAMLEILPIMMQIKIQETRTEVKNIERAAEASRNKADAIMETAKLKSQQLMLDAINCFVEAGIMVSQMVSSAVMQLGGQVINAGIGIVNIGVGAVNSSISAGAGMVSGLLGGGGGGGGFQLPAIPNIDTEGAGQMIDKGLSAGGSVAKGVVLAMKAKLELLVGQQEFMKTMWEYIQDSAQKAQSSANESKRNAAELFSSFIQALLQFIQQEQVFAFRPGG